MIQQQSHGILGKFCSAQTDPVTLVSNDIDVFIPRKEKPNWFSGSEFTVHVTSSKKFKSPDIRGLLEFEWEEYVEEQKKALRDETWVFNDKAMTYVNGEFLGKYVQSTHPLSRI